jgi:hypothetical protein
VKMLVQQGANPAQPAYIQGTTELCTPAAVRGGMICIHELEGLVFSSALGVMLDAPMNAAGKATMACATPTLLGVVSCSLPWYPCPTILPSLEKCCSGPREQGRSCCWLANPACPTVPRTS